MMFQKKVEPFNELLFKTNIVLEISPLDRNTGYTKIIHHIWSIIYKIGSISIIDKRLFHNKFNISQKSINAQAFFDFGHLPGHFTWAFAQTYECLGILHH